MAIRPIRTIFWDISIKIMDFIHWNTLKNVVCKCWTFNPGLNVKPCLSIWWLHQKASWWRHEMETFSALLVLCAGKSPVTGEFPAQRPVTRNFDVFFDLRLIYGWENNGEAGHLRRHSTHYGVIVMIPYVLIQHIHDIVDRTRNLLLNNKNNGTKWGIGSGGNMHHPPPPSTKPFLVLPFHKCYIYDYICCNVHKRNGQFIHRVFQHCNKLTQLHYGDVMMGAMASQITSLTIVYSTVYSGIDHREHQSSASLAFVRGIHRWIPRTKGQ